MLSEYFHCRCNVRLVLDWKGNDNFVLGEILDNFFDIAGNIREVWIGGWSGDILWMSVFNLDPASRELGKIIVAT